ncbi:uncharacterized protein PAC_14222 [Phialocephala subalpina]|uniref:Uncharacterized protein n=1 Tax=Phialocephala subalpina TaxID=576137 RepID=A0A1L7XH20_9HELO|nr:uncharacterized protein PAC_14222 [Phialocephala subalpina]
MGFLSSVNLRKVAIVLGLIVLIKVLLSYQNFSYHEHALPSFIPSYSPSKTPQGYSIKPVAYVFPQYYVFEDNSRLHGENFTEWVNVNKTTHNAFGLETIRPHESIGYYDGLEFQTRQRQGKFLRDSGFYGVAFHHYWFAGRPVMDHVIKAMLEDGEPDINFMLSWANEPWTARWDGGGKGGNEGSTLIGQDYGLQQAWRKHFDWLLPFFRHPKYIRSEGRVQFMVYNPSHMGHIAPEMFAAFRQWAVEEGLGGMDIIETRWGEGSTIGPDSWRGHPPDAINEFQPHAGGRDIAKFSSLERLSRVYHRGTLACWDTTPRHPTDGRAICLPACHPTPWKHHLVEMFRKIKSDPNPIGAENFFFVNALNEWGEGNAIEPSAQFGDGYGVAMKKALEISDREHAWPDHSIKASTAHDERIKAAMNETVDVCVLVRTSPVHAESEVFTLSAMLRSLQAQNNQKWRAIVYQKDRSEFPSLSKMVLQALDPRINHAVIPKEVVLPKERTEGFTATDWVLKNLTDLDTGCASARYFLVTDGHNTYEPGAFDSLGIATADLVGLNFESRNNIWNHPDLKNTSWAARCDRLEHPALNFCKPSAPTPESFDLTATFISLPKFLSTHLTFAPPTTSNLTTKDHTTSTNPSIDPSYPLISTLTTTHHFTHSRTSPTTQSCQAKHNPTYSSCLKTGNFWFDSPLYHEVGCYTSSDFIDVVGKKSPFLRDADLGNATVMMEGVLRDVGVGGGEGKEEELKATLS